MAKFVESLKDLFRFKPISSADNLLVLNVKCGHCEETVTLRVNTVTDLQPDWDSGKGGFLLSKEVQDSKCFKIMKLTARFDREKRLLEQSVSGGEIIS
jgi:hypothetical protein